MKSVTGQAFSGRHANEMRVEGGSWHSEFTPDTPEASLECICETSLLPAPQGSVELDSWSKAKGRGVLFVGACGILGELPQQECVRHQYQYQQQSPETLVGHQLSTDNVL